MQVRAVSAAAAIVVVALSTAACNPTTKSKATSTTPTQVPVATETQADAASPAATTASSLDRVERIGKHQRRGQHAGDVAVCARRPLRAAQPSTFARS